MEISKVSCENDFANGRYSKQIWQYLENGSEVGGLGGAKVYFKLAVIKPSQLKCLWEFSNYIKSSDGNEIIQNGYLHSGIPDAIKIEITELPCLDNFQDIN